MFTLFLLNWERVPWLTVNSNSGETCATCSTAKVSEWRMLWTVRDNNFPAPYYSKLILINIFYLHCILFCSQTLLSNGSRSSDRLYFVTKWENIVKGSVREPDLWEKSLVGRYTHVFVCQQNVLRDRVTQYHFYHLTWNEIPLELLNSTCFGITFYVFRIL